MPTLSYSTFVAGPADVGLAIIVGGTVLVALLAHALALAGWLRRH
jgi:hypothetical protein